MSKKGIQKHTKENLNVPLLRSQLQCLPSCQLTGWNAHTPTEGTNTGSNSQSACGEGHTLAKEQRNNNRDNRIRGFNESNFKIFLKIRSQYSGNSDRFKFKISSNSDSVHAHVRQSFEIFEISFWSVPIQNSDLVHAYIRNNFETSKLKIHKEHTMQEPKCSWRLLPLWHHVWNFQIIFFNFNFFLRKLRNKRRHRPIAPGSRAHHTQLPRPSLSPPLAAVNSPPRRNRTHERWWCLCAPAKVSQVVKDKICLSCHLSATIQFFWWCMDYEQVKITKLSPGQPNNQPLGHSPKRSSLFRYEGIKWALGRGNTSLAQDQTHHSRSNGEWMRRTKVNSISNIQKKRELW